MNLARAVYSDSDIFILDDPLSAVDVRVGRQIFHACIRTLLKEKTVLLVTHQLQVRNRSDLNKLKGKQPRGFGGIGGGAVMRVLLNDFIFLYEIISH